VPSRTHDGLDRQIAPIQLQIRLDGTHQKTLPFGQGRELNRSLGFGERLQLRDILHFGGQERPCHQAQCQ
jgi:hypothetical protein